MGNSSQKEKKKEKAHQEQGDATLVLLNVYNLQPGGGGGGKAKTTFNGALGFGFYHSGVEVLGEEWCFGGHPNAPANLPGIFPMYPKSALPPEQFHTQIVVCRAPGLDLLGLHNIIGSLVKDWMACSYHMLNHNCNHFSEVLCNKIGEVYNVPVKFPAFVNRAAKFADVFVPERVYRSMMRNVPQPPAQSEGAPNPSHYRPPPQFQQNEKTEDASETIPLATVAEAEKMSVRELKTMMWVNGVSWDGCIEKSDLIAAVKAFREANGLPP